MNPVAFVIDIGYLVFDSSSASDFYGRFERSRYDSPNFFAQISFLTRDMAGLVEALDISEV